MIIAVTYSDEVNMMACQIAHSLFSVPTKVARVRAQNYLASEWNDLFSTDNLPIDVVISPEVEIGKSILRRLNTPGAFDVVPFADGRVQLIGIRIKEDTPIINTPLRQITDLFPGLHSVVVGIKRDGEIFAPTDEDALNPGDEAYVITLAEHASRLLEIIGNTNQKARQIVIIGGGSIGAYVAGELEKDLAIDLIIDPRATTVSSILRHVRRGRILDVFSIDEGSAEVMEGEVLETSPLAGKRLDSAEIGEGVAIGAVINDGRVQFPTPDLIVRPGDRLVLLAERGALKTVEQLFRVSMDYF